MSKTIVLILGVAWVVTGECWRFGCWAYRLGIGRAIEYLKGRGDDK